MLQVYDIEEIKKSTVIGIFGKPGTGRTNLLTKVIDTLAFCKNHSDRHTVFLMAEKSAARVAAKKEFIGQVFISGPDDTHIIENFCEKQLKKRTETGGCDKICIVIDSWDKLDFLSKYKSLATIIFSPEQYSAKIIFSGSSFGTFGRSSKKIFDTAFFFWDSSVFHTSQINFHFFGNYSINFFDGITADELFTALVIDVNRGGSKFKYKAPLRQTFMTKIINKFKKNIMVNISYADMDIYFQ